MPVLQVAIDARGAAQGAGEFESATGRMTSSAQAAQDVLRGLDDAVNSVGRGFSNAEGLQTYKDRLVNTIDTLKSKVNELSGGTGAKLDLAGDVSDEDIARLQAYAEARERVQGGSPTDKDISIIRQMEEATASLTEAERQLLTVEEQIAAQRKATADANAETMLEADTVGFGKKSGAIKGKSSGFEDADLSALEGQWNKRSQEIEGSFNRVGNASENMGAKLPSGFHGLSRLFTGFGMLFLAAEAAGRAFDEFQKALIKVEERGAPLTLKETAQTFENMTAAALKSLPIFGQFFALGQKIGGELFGGNAEIRKNEREAKRLEEVTNKQKDARDALRDHKGTLDDFNRSMEETDRLRNAKREGGDNGEAMERVRIENEKRLLDLKKQEDAIINDPKLANPEANPQRQALLAQVEAAKKAAEAENALAIAEEERRQKEELQKKKQTVTDAQERQIFALLDDASSKFYQNYDENLHDIGGSTESFVNKLKEEQTVIEAINSAVEDAKNTTKEYEDRVKSLGESGTQTDRRHLQEKMAEAEKKVKELEDLSKRPVGEEWSSNDKIMNDYALKDARKKLDQIKEEGRKSGAELDKIDAKDRETFLIDHEKDLQSQLEKIKLDSMEEGKAKRLAMIDAEQKEELARLAEEAKKLGVTVDLTPLQKLIQQKYDAQRAVVNRSMDVSPFGLPGSQQATPLSSRFVGYAQTFNSQLEILQAQLDIQKKTAEASTRTAKATEAVSTAVAGAQPTVSTR